MMVVFALIVYANLLIQILGFRVLVKNADGQLVPNGTYFTPYEKGFVGTYGDPRNLQRERINEGAYQTSDQELLNEGVDPRQQCPGMVGPFSDGSYYCTAREYGYCDRRSGTCFCNAGYKGIDCSECQDSHYQVGYLCFPKKLCPLDCSGAGTCDHSTGLCYCLPHRIGTACETLLCSIHSDLCETCTVSTCLMCASGYYLTGDAKVCGSCYDFDPRCSGCTRELGCTDCADSVLTSVRRSGYRKPADPDLPIEETVREFSIAWPFGTKSSDSFADAEYYFVCTTPQAALRDSAVSCVQGERNDDSWNCTHIETSHRVCGHYGVFTFVYPNYAIAEKGKSITMQVRRTGGGYGHVNINYFIKHFTTNDSDLVATAPYTTNQRLTFNQGVIERSFKIDILDDNVVEENEVFQVVLEVPEGGGSVGAQFRTNVTIIDDDASLISAKLSKLLQNTTNAIAGQSFSVHVQAMAADGEKITMGGERFLAIIENNLQMWDDPPTASHSQRHSYRKACDVVDNGDGTYEAQCPPIEEQGVYQLRVWHGLQGIQGQYYYDGFFDRLAVQRLDHNVNFTWGKGKLMPRGKDYVSIRWTGAILTNQGGSYQFKVDADDHSRLWLDGQLLIDHFHETYTNLEPARSMHLLADTLYEVVLEFRELTGDAYAHLMWGYDGKPPVVIPETNLYALYEIDRSPVLVTIYSSDTSADATECTGDGLYEAQALHESYFSFCPRDMYRNLRDDLDLFYLSSDLFTANLTLLDDLGHGGVGPETIVPSIAYNNNTHCFDASYIPTIAGHYQLEIIHELTRGEGMAQVAGSPFYLDISVDKMSGPKSLLYGLPAMLYMQAGSCHDFTIIARDNAQNYIFSGGNNIQVYTYQVDHYSIEDGVPIGSPLTQRPGYHTIAPRPSDQLQNIVREGSVVDHGNGTYTAQICPVIAGIHEIHVLLNGRGVSNQHYQILNMPQSLQQPLGEGSYFGEYIANSPYYLVVSHTRASAFTSTAMGRGLQSPQIVGIPTSFMITVRDPYDNVLRTSTPGVSVIAKLDRSPSVVIPIWDYRNGSYEVEYTPLLAGTNTISVYIDGSLMRYSPFSIDVIDGRTSANYSFAMGKGLHTGRTGDVSYFQVYAFDLNDNRKTSYDDIYHFIVSGSNNITGTMLPCPVGQAAAYHPVCDVDDALAGHYFGYFTPYIAGEITIAVYLVVDDSHPHAGGGGGGQVYRELFNSPFTAMVVPSDPKAELSDVSGTLYDTIAGTSSSVEVHLRDYFGNSLQMGGYSLEIALLGVADTWGTVFPLPAQDQGLPNQYNYRGFYHHGYPNVYGLAIDHMDGSYTLSYTADQAGEYVMRLALAEIGLNATYFNDTTFGYLFDEDFNLLSFESSLQGRPINPGSSISWTGDIGRRPGIRGDLGEGTYLNRYISRLEYNISVDLRNTNMNNYFNNDNNALYKFRDEYWSARWTGLITPEAAEVYKFTIDMDDDASVSIRIGGRGLETNNSDPGMLVVAADRNEVLPGYYNFTDTKYREFVVHYIHYAGEAKLNIYWESLTTPKRLIPTSAFTHWRNISHYNTTIHPSSLCSSCSTVYGDALTTAQVAVKKSFLLYARDVYGNLLEVGGDQPTMVAVGKDEVAFRGVVTDYGNSTYLVEYYPTQAGLFFMYVTVGCCVASSAMGLSEEIRQNAALQVQHSPFILNITSAPVDQTRSIAIGTGLIGGLVGDAMAFTVYYRDIYNNPTTVRDDEYQTITVTIVEQASNTTIQPIDLHIIYGTSNSTIQYALDRSGQYLLYVYVTVNHHYNNNNDDDIRTTNHRAKQIIASPFQITTHASKAIAAHSICRGIGLRQAMVHKNVSFEIQLYDIYHNPLIMGGNRFYVRLQGDASFHSSYDIAPVCRDQQNGRTTCSYSPLYEGTHQLNIRLLNNSIASPGGLGLTGYYYTSRDGAHGGNHDDASSVAYVRIDNKVSFYWPNGLLVPTNDSATVDAFIPLTDAGQSVRWEGYVLSPRSDVFKVTARATNMNVSIYIDERLVYDNSASIEASVAFVLDSSYAIRIIAVADADVQTTLLDGSVVHSMLPMSIELRWSTPSIKEYVIPKFFLYDSAYDVAYSPFPVVVR